MRVPVTGSPDIKLTSRGVRGLCLYQATSRIELTSADILGLVDAIVAIATQNKAQGKQP
jgi:hypothetical protein